MGEMLDRIVVVEGKLRCGARVLGPDTNFYLYPGEEAHMGGERVVVCATPYAIDLVFTLPDGKVVGGEVKRPDDLVRSHHSRRLARQLRTLLAVVDVPVLVLRGGVAIDDLSRLVCDSHRRPWEFWEDLTGMQTRGVYLLPVPMEGYWPWVEMFRAALITGGARSLAGDDRKKGRADGKGWLLKRIPGIGPVHASRLIARYGSSLKVLQAAGRGQVAEEFGKGMEERLCRAARD